MATSFLTLTDAVVTALQAAPALAGGHIRRGRNIPVPENVDQAIDVHVRTAGGDLDDLDGTAITWQTTVGIDLYARAADGTDAEAAIDSLIADVFERFAAATPPSGLVAWLMTPSITWEMDEADDTLVLASLSLSVQHHTDTELAPL